jgi:glycosyltransferase involved in cell wall biosynthesis
MRVVVTVENRFAATPDGVVWTSAAFPYSFWLRYLDVFEQVQIVSRMQKVSSVSQDYLRVDGNGVEVVPVPYYRGPSQFLRVSPGVIRVTRSAVSNDAAVIMRVPSLLATCIEPALYSSKHPFGVEVVGDPFDVFASGAMQHPLRPIFRWWYTRAQQRQCARANATAYVTRHALQRRYPCRAHMVGVSDVDIDDSALVVRNDTLTTYYSSIELDAVGYADKHFPPPAVHKCIQLVTVGSLEHFYKAPDVLIRAVAQCVQDGLDLKLVMVGDGKRRKDLEALAGHLNIKNRVQFIGQVPPGAAVRARLDSADIFVLPSLQEGLPRAMIEAMARGLPCIGSTVGGIPELLPSEDTVPPGDVIALASKIREVGTDPVRMARMSVRNFDTAREYHVDKLRSRRIEFYQYVRTVTEDWLKGKT